MASHFPFLSEEQKEKIKKLEKELHDKKEYEKKHKHRKEETSKLHGIPIDVVDMDVIKIGILLGLIQKKNNRENGVKNNTLLELLLGEDQKEVDVTKFDSHYRNARRYVDEDKKMQFISQHVHKQSEFYADMINTIIRDSLHQVKQVVEINLQHSTLQDFKTIVQDVLEITLDELVENKNAVKQDWITMNTVRRVLLGPLDVCEYKKLLLTCCEKLYASGKNYNDIINSLSTIEKRMILFPRCLSKKTNPFTTQDAVQLKNELLIRNYNKDPKMLPFDLHTFVYHCCTPLLLMVPIDVILKYSLLNPYLNNSIVYLKLESSENGSDPWSFYILKTITDEKVRLWVLDNKLFRFIGILRSRMLRYLVNMFKVFYFECFNTHSYISNFQHHAYHGDVFTSLLKNIKYTCSLDFVHFIQRLVQDMSFIIPTQYDFFNQLVASNVDDYKSINPNNLLTNMFETKHVEDIFNHV